MNTQKNHFQLDLTFDSYPNDQSFSFLEISKMNNYNEFEFWKNEIETWFKYIQKDSDSICPSSLRNAQNLSVGLRFTDDIQICELNKKWRNIQKKTDVLSFPVFDDVMVGPNGSCIELGDIVVSVQTAVKQASDHGNNLGDELRWLVSHGLLHLIGWDHPDEHSLETMLAFQEYLTSITSESKSGSKKI